MRGCNLSLPERRSLSICHGIWKARPGKLRQKDRDARWTVKFTKAKAKEDGSTPACDIAIPVFGYQNHVSIDRGFGFIRKCVATDAAAYEGARLREGLLDKTNTAFERLGRYGLSVGGQRGVHREERLRQPRSPQKAQGKPMPDTVRRANAERSKVRSRVEHVFAEQKDRMGLFICKRRYLI